MPRQRHGSGRNFSLSSQGLPSFGKRVRRIGPSRRFYVPPTCQFRAGLWRDFATMCYTRAVHGSGAVLLPETDWLARSNPACHP